MVDNIECHRNWGGKPLSWGE